MKFLTGRNLSVQNLPIFLKIIQQFCCVNLCYLSGPCKFKGIVKWIQKVAAVFIHAWRHNVQILIWPYILALYAA